MSDSVRPHRRKPTRLPRPWDFPGKNTEWVAISFSNAWKWKVKVKSLSRVWLLATPWTAAHQAPPSMGFSRQEYWSGVLLPSLKQTLLVSDWKYVGFLNRSGEAIYYWAWLLSDKSGFSELSGVRGLFDSHLFVLQLVSASLWVMLCFQRPLPKSR